jgi:hypothetical protein
MSQNPPIEWPSAVPPQLSAGREGSDAAVRLLLLLHRRPEGLSLSGIATVSGLLPGVAEVALDGLKSRHRVACVGRGKAARWMLTQHAPQHGAASSEAQA